ncbi:type VI secretion system contractile sheath large subunit [Corallococcus praedator]|uniref:Type VI secretion system contractile sheath large subunit n=1 Tax=Corallococcus praedator TaxID=2316724 RepID=A0ABX9QDH4_9BACT|nr:MULTISPECIES: type VI secretion system contractile sheath large subunit [Corallococcus]RKH12218.1 type VI secretion system contractile sheath large subunit [Corallococcus sp. CA047B]RKH25631.1 type VI secretion system contractile sheath large subunit [Corallococcus sp. CA031C]RKI02923.1 type VI secretion system contractile sheath large subunit [Corallococcus praedator]
MPTQPASPNTATTAVADPPLDLPLFLNSVRLGAVPAPRTPTGSNELLVITEDATPEERFVSSLAAMVHNMDTDEGRFDKQTVQELVGTIDALVSDQLNAVLHAPEFQEVEAQWTALNDLVRNTNFKANIELSLLDVSKEEAYSDLEMNAADVAGSEFFKKLYVAEYDQYGGAPYGALVGLFEFANTPQDMLWLKTMGKIAAASHAPFVASVAPRFFGCESMKEVSQLRDVASLLDAPKYSAWNALRETDEAAYVGLTMPRYIVRPPYNPETYPAPGMNFKEAVKGDKEEEYLWGNSAMLFARNLVRSFATSGWCQHIRGPKGGGLVAGLPVHLTHLRGEEEMKLPVEMSIPDFRELELANGGFIPLIHKKGSAEAVFFSVQSLKKAQVFEDAKDSENSQLVTNLAYTYSISRIAHYVKAIMRENIGSTANAAYMQQQLDRWISRYVTTLVNPDDLTLRYYPFKAYNLTVAEVPGKVGWFHCNLSVLPHIQFEGMNVDLRVDARLG